MKKVFLVLMVIVVMLSACNTGRYTGDGLINDSKGKNGSVVVADARVETDSVEGGDSAKKAPVDLVEDIVVSLSDEDLLDDLTTRLTDVFMQRAEVLNERRDIGNVINSGELSFEDRKFFEKAFSILNQRESQLTLEIAILESKIAIIKRRVEGKENLGAYLQILDDLRRKEVEITPKVRNVTQQIIDLRTAWLNDEISTSDYLDKLSPLESKEAALMNELSSVLEKIEFRQGQVDEINSGELPDDMGTLLLKRNRITEELNVVRNDLVDSYIKLKSAAESIVSEVENRISELEDREDDLEDELIDVDKDLE